MRHKVFLSCVVENSHRSHLHDLWVWPKPKLSSFVRKSCFIHWGSLNLTLWNAFMKKYKINLNSIVCLSLNEHVLRGENHLDFAFRLETSQTKYKLWKDKRMPRGPNFVHKACGQPLSLWETKAFWIIWANLVFLATKAWLQAKAMGHQSPMSKQTAISESGWQHHISQAAMQELLHIFS